MSTSQNDSSSSWIDPQNLYFHDNDDESLAIQLQQQFNEDLTTNTNNDEDNRLALLLQQQFDEDLAIHTQNTDPVNDNEDKRIAMQLQLQFDEDFARRQGGQNQTPTTINDLNEDENIAMQLQKQFDEDFAKSQAPSTVNDLNDDENIAMRLQQQFDAQSQVPTTTNRSDEDKDFAMRLQQQFDEDFAQIPDTTNNNSDEDRRLAIQLQQQLEEVSTATNNNNSDEDRRLAIQLQQEVSTTTNNNSDEDRRLAIQLQQQLEVNDRREDRFGEDLGREGINEGIVTFSNEIILPGEIVSEDNLYLGSIIQGFKENLEQQFPEAAVKKVQLSTRNKQLMWTEFIAAIKGFNEIDFIKRPKISFLNEPAIDASGVFNDTIRQILEMFMSLENPEYGGDGHLFIGDSTKIISNTAPVDFMDELDVFGDILFLAIIHEAPFPTDLDITLFKHCLDLKNSISLDDLKNVNVQKYNLAKELLSTNPETNLSTIVGFDEWAEEKEITPVQKRMYARSKENLEKLSKQICEEVLINSRITQLNAIKKKLNKFGFFDLLKAKQVKIGQIKEYMYKEVMTPDDIIHRLVSLPNLNERQNNVLNWLIEWLRGQKKDKLQEFCRLATGFTHPRHEIKITFKSTFFQEPPDVRLTPKFETCSQEIKLSENFSSKEELFKTMNAQVNTTVENENFTVV